MRRANLGETASDVRHVFVYINKDRHIVASVHEIPIRMSDPWPVVKVLWHRVRGIVTGEQIHEIADAYQWGEIMKPDYEQVLLTRVKVAIPDEAPASYAASWAFANLDRLEGGA